jgi:hypothetical protein
VQDHAARQPRGLKRLWARFASRAPAAEADTHRQGRVPSKHLLGAYVVASVAALIVLRALVDALDFISVGWILVLAGLPLLPWLLPRLGDFLKAISPYVQTVSLSGLKLDLRAFERDPISVPSSGKFADVPNDFNALSSGTKIDQLVSSLRELRRKGAGPIGVIDLRDGRKWRLPNLYFLARLLELEPVVSQLVYTEARGGIDGYFVASCQPGGLRGKIEQAVSSYADASRGLELPSDLDLTDAGHSQKLAQAFSTFLGKLPQSSIADDDPVRGYVTSAWVRNLPTTVISTAEIEAGSETLSAEDVAKVLDSPYRFVPATTDGLLSGLVDREAVALAVARAMRAQDTSS